MILSVTAQQAEVIRYAQLQANPLLTLSLVLRSPDDFIDPATGQPVPPVVVRDDRYHPQGTDRQVRRAAAGHRAAGPAVDPARSEPAGIRTGPRSIHRDPTGVTDHPVPRPSKSPADRTQSRSERRNQPERHGRPDPRPRRGRHPGDPRSPDEAARLRDGYRRGRLGVVRSRGDRHGRPDPSGRRPDGHQHAGHGRDHRHRAAVDDGARRGGRDDVGPGRGGLPPSLDAGRRTRVPGQAVQQRRIDRLHPPGQLARAREAEPDRRPDTGQWRPAGRHGPRVATGARTARSSRSSARRAASAGRPWPSTSPSRRTPSSGARSSSWTARSSSATSASCSTSIRAASRSPS